MKDGVVRIRIRAIFRFNSEGIPRLFIRRVKLGEIKSVKGIVGVRINSRVI
jgi:hypothetical protein